MVFLIFLCSSFLAKLVLSVVWSVGIREWGQKGAVRKSLTIVGLSCDMLEKTYILVKLYSTMNCSVVDGELDANELAIQVK